MKLLGFEVRDYGRFEAQYVPLERGIHILAGLNNSGKTSLLLALKSFSQSGGIPYTHPENQSKISLIFEMEGTEGLQVNTDPAAPFIDNPANGRLFVDFTFNPIRFVRARIEREDQVSGIWLEQKQAGVFKYTLRPDGQYGSSGQVIVRQEVALRELEPLLPGISEMHKVVFIPSRRNGSAQNESSTNVALPVDGTNLASYLATLQLNDTDGFDALNKVFCSVFPYLKRVNAQSTSNSLEVRVTYLDNGQVVPLIACGTGVEQLLILLTCVMRSPENGIVMIDEPHLFLHPTAERALLSFLKRYPEKTILLATHSFIMINSVPPDRVTHVTKGGTSYCDRRLREKDLSVSGLLSALGYKNSDLLFSNKLLFVEGPSDVAILPNMLKTGGASESDVDWLGMPQLEGANPVKNTADMVRQIVRYESLVKALGRNSIPRLYLLDGDRDHAEVRRMTLGENASALLLKKEEIENYMLQPSAIAKAIASEAKTYDLEIHPSESNIEIQISNLAKENITKGSRVLSKIYEGYKLSYSKVHGGKLISQCLTSEWAPLSELFDELKPFLSQSY